MAKAKIYEQGGSERGTVELPATLFDAEVNEPVLHQSIVAYLANQRQGTAKTKGRSDVRGGACDKASGCKPSGCLNNRELTISWRSNSHSFPLPNYNRPVTIRDVASSANWVPRSVTTAREREPS